MDADINDGDSALNDPQTHEPILNNLPLQRIQHAGMTVEGYSRGAVQTYFRIPEFKLGFDLGGSPWSFMGTQTFFVSHGHLDHMAAMPAYVARRRMMKMEPPTIYVPEEIAENCEKLLRAWQRLDRGRMLCELVGVTPGQEIELSREHIVTVFATKHTVPSVGYILWDRRKKLRPEYHGLEGEQIRDLRQQGVEVTHELRKPLVAFTGDTAPAGLDAHPATYEAEILITEMTFFRPEHRRQKIHKFGHMHLDDIIERADRFQNGLIILGHLSTRYTQEHAQRVLEKRLPEQLQSRVKLWA